MDAPEARSPGGIRHDRAHTARDRARDGARSAGRTRSGPGRPRAGRCQVFGQPATDIGRKGHPFATVSLAAHGDRARAPVDIVEPEPGDLAAPQTEPDQQGQNRQIAAADGRMGDRMPREGAAPDRARAPWAARPAGGERPSARRETSDRSVTPSRCRKPRNERSAVTVSFATPPFRRGHQRHHERDDIGRGQVPEFETIGRHPAVQKRAQAINIPNGRHREPGCVPWSGTAGIGSRISPAGPSATGVSAGGAISSPRR